jgi:hypothetical protein
VQWRMGELDDGADSLAVQLAPAAHWPNLRYSGQTERSHKAEGTGPCRRPAQLSSRRRGYGLHCCGRCKGTCYTAWAGRSCSAVSFCQFKLRGDSICTYLSHHSYQSRFFLWILAKNFIKICRSLTNKRLKFVFIAIKAIFLKRFLRAP